MDATPRTFESLNATGTRMNFRNLAADTLTFSIPLASLASTAEIIPELGQTVTLLRSGARIFHGHVTGRRQVGRVISITVSGPWWWLERIFLESAQTDSTGATADRPTYVFPAQSLTVSLQNLATKAAALGVPMGIGTLASTFDSPPMRVNQVSYAGAIADLVRVTPDMVLYFNYAASPPQLGTVRRLSGLGGGSATSQTLDARLLEGFNLNPITELEVKQVRVPYMTLNATGKKTFAAQSAGTAALGKVYLHIVSGAEMDTFLPPDATITPGSTLGVKTLPAAISNLLVQTLDTEIAANYKKFAGNVGGSSTSTTMWAQANPAVKVPNGRPSKCVDAAGRDVALAGKYVLLSKDLPDWAMTQLGGVKVTYSGTWYAQFGATYGLPRPSQPPWWTDLAAGATTGTAFVYKPTATLIHPEQYCWLQRPWKFTATLVNKSAASLEPVQRGADYAFRFPPAGYAAGLLAAQNYIPYEGGFTVVADDAGGTRFMASAINFSNSQAAHASIRAMVSEEEIDIGSGKTTVRLGPPARFSYRELVNRVRTNSNDQIIYL
jgi:hypothetical protein